MTNKKIWTVTTGEGTVAFTLYADARSYAAAVRGRGEPVFAGPEEIDPRGRIGGWSSAPGIRGQISEVLRG